MERFENEGFEGFYGETDIDNHVNIIRETFSATAEIRQKPGKKGYLLETYLSIFLNSAMALKAAAPEPDRIGSELITTVHHPKSSVRCDTRISGFNYGTVRR